MYTPKLHSFFGDNQSDQDFINLISATNSGVGKTTKEDIDRIRQRPKATSISIVGLDQDTFDYFIDNYAGQFKAIQFWKCPGVFDLSKLEQLQEVACIQYSWNQRATRLWDFAKNLSLLYLGLSDFSRVNDSIVDIGKAQNLVELSFGGGNWSQAQVASLQPLADLDNLKMLSFSSVKVKDSDITWLASLKKLKVLRFPDSLFTTEQLAWLKSKLPDVESAEVLEAFSRSERNGAYVGVKINGKRKPFLSNSHEDADKIKRYVQAYSQRLEWYKLHPQARPEDYLR